ncbi:MAG TPA: hypothetical protein VEF33_03635 [Syntrophales bacterium]|nr:hypothetical protein [Syntrophales bacterium]
MYQTRNYETVNMILRNPSLWNESMIKETLQRFKKSNSYTEQDFNPLNVQALIKNYLHTLSDTMKKEESVRKEIKNKDVSHDFSNVLVSGV